MADLNDFNYTDDLDDVLAIYVNNLLASTMRSEYKNVETLSADKTLTDADTPIQRLNCNGAARIVKVPTEDAVENHPFFIVNSSASAYSITLKSNDAATILATVTQGESVLVMPDGNGTYKTAVTLQSIGAVANSGWTAVTDAWAYASASTITIPTDGTTVYQKGVKIRFKQGGGFKYYVGSTVAATLLTVAVNSDYTVANSAITDISYSYAENPFGWPDWFAFAPTITGFSANPTTTVYRYAIRGRQCSIYIRQTPAGTSNATTLTFTLPVAAATITNMFWQGMGIADDNGSPLADPAVLYIASAGTTLSVAKDSTLAGFTASGGKRLGIGNITYEW